VREDVLYLHLHVLLRRAVSGDIHVSVVRRSIGHVAKPQNRATVPPTAIAKTRVAGSSPGRLIADIRRPATGKAHLPPERFYLNKLH